MEWVSGMMDLLGLCWNAPPSLISRSILRSSGRGEAARGPDELDPHIVTQFIGQKSDVCIVIEVTEGVAPWPVDLVGWKMSGIITGYHQIYHVLALLLWL